MPIIFLINKEIFKIRFEAAAARQDLASKEETNTLIYIKVLIYDFYCMRFEKS